MESLIHRQSDIVETIKQIERNFGKDAASRKTRKYLDERLDALDKLWAEFQSNNDKLSVYENHKEPYFAEQQYDKVRKYFESVRTKIATSSVAENIPSFPTPKSPAPGIKLVLPSLPTPAGTSKPSKDTSELQSLQQTNFRAFNRAMRSLRVEEIRDKWELEDELRSIQKRWKTIDTLHLQIDNILQGSDEEYDQQFYSFEDLYKNIKRALNEKLASTAHLEQSTPKLDIPVFTGNFTQWPTFYDLYIETIHNNNGLSKCQKMQHLKGKLKGEPERLIQHLNIASDNYDTAWELLVHRYNNPQLLFTKHIELFLNQPSLQKQSSYEIKRLFDTSLECIHAIQNLGVDTSTWDPLLVHLIAKKMDSETYLDYKEARKSPRDIPELKELMEFLEAKFTALEPIHKKERETAVPNQPQKQGTHYQKPLKYGNYGNFGKYPKKEFQAHPSVTSNIICPLCSQNHTLFHCDKFSGKDSDAKLRLVAQLNVCRNCLYKHGKPCKSGSVCRVCKQNHNTVLHEAICKQSTSPLSAARTATMESRAPTLPSTSNELENRQHSVNYVTTDDEEILLTTVTIKVMASDGSYVTMRGLLDQGAQTSLISENSAQMLGLQRQRFHASVSGIGNGSKQSKGIVSLHIASIYGDHQFTTQALVINRVTNSLPNTSFGKQQWPHLAHIQLADPDYNVSKPIDFLLDASVYSDIIMSGLIKGPGIAPIAQQTKLGWILSGNIKTFHCHVVINHMEDLAQYWELEEISDTTSNLTQSEQYCEELYQSTTRRLSDGRYEVAIPMKPKFENHLGNSRPKAVAQFHNLENKMARNEEFSDSYKQFMKDYETMNHMKEVTNKTDAVSCYLPHHGVLKSDSTTTKLRTVFNASAKTSSGFSLNDLMEQGPNLQKDLHSLILGWRQHKYVITADIEKMFRQILIRESDQHLTRIIWRSSAQMPLKEYNLQTVTYGTKAAPWLAMRTLKQIAIDGAEKYPRAAEALSKSFYVDDLLEGGQSIKDTRCIQQEIINLLKEAGMNIRKWSSNTPELTEHLSAEQLDTPLNFRCADTRKTLGLCWNSNKDTFSFQNKFDDEESNSDTSLTKRELLSHISKIFDPIGWLSPLTVRAKLLFQRTWSDQSVEWDKQIPLELNKEWKLLKKDFQSIDKIEIPRYLGDRETFQIHGFCDSSEKGYACSIYFVSRKDKGQFTSKLITAKTKLAPSKNKLTLPRMELCGALLLSRLMKKLTEGLTVDNNQIFAWTDSMVVLGWIHGDTNRWKPFVANRIQSITNIIPATNWHHVRSEDNAADCATRGLTAAQLQEHSLWWEGPHWLSNFDAKMFKNKTYESPTVETKKAQHRVHAALNQTNDLVIKLLNEQSSMSRVVITIGWLKRYTCWLRNHKQTTKRGYLSSAEIEEAYKLVNKTAQAMVFEEDLDRLRTGKETKKGSKIASLSPYIEKSDGLLRVGGRLNNSLLSQSAKHPIILPSHGRLTELIIQQAHAFTNHGGPRLTLSYIREKYWILSGLRTVKRELRKCVKCRRYNKEKITQIMADLPKPRVTPSRAFSHTGVDFTGFYDIKANKGRGVRTHKGYVAVFVCLASRATHLELVSDLTTQGFLAAFRRFCARRSTPSHMYSDNGTNFIGASRLLKQEYQAIMATINEDLVRKTSDLQIKWSFNCPAFPSAGGLWEAAVKSFKHHLRRVMGEQKLTYEEFITLLQQIEACLNSRPLIELTENPEDEYLTPGHFLVGGPLLSRPQTDPDNMNLTTRWKLIQNMNKQFWKKWSTEYLNTLQTRTKWRNARPNLQVDDIVLIQEDNIPPGKWLLGRIIEVHPGKDGHVRIVTLKTKNGIMKRPVVKLSVLPTKEAGCGPQIQSDTTASTDSQQTTIINATANQQTNQSRSRRVRKPARNFITMAVLLCLSIFTPATGFYNVSEFENNQDIYFDKMYDMHLIKDDWKLIIYYNMSTYWTGIRNIEDYVSHIENHVKFTGISEEKQYKGVVYQLRHELSEIQHYNRILIQGQVGKRQKRGLINGVGYIANTLFGVLDERFARNYEKDIEKISYNENHLQVLLKNQTSVIEAQYNLLHRNEAIMNKQFRNIDQHLQEFRLEKQRMRVEYDDEFFTLSTLLTAEIIISNIRNVQQKLINTITELTQGHLDAQLVPPEQLEEQVNIIYSNLPADLTLPADKQRLEDLYKIMKINVKLGEKFFIIETKIPLVNKEQFQLDRIISLPHKDHVVETTAPYIAFNLQKDLLILLTEADMQECIHISTNRVLCSIDKPIYEVQITKSICNLRVHSRSLCRAKTTNACDEQWIKLHNNNRWMFTCCEECAVRIFCPDSKVHMSSLTGNGLLDVGQGCSIRSKTFTISGHHNFLSHINVNSELAVIPETSILNQIVNTSDIEPYKEEDHGIEWHNIKAQIDSLKQQVDTPLTIHDVHQYSALLSILVLIILAGVTYATIRWRKARKVQKQKDNRSQEMKTTATSGSPEEATGPAQSLHKTPNATPRHPPRLVIPYVSDNNI